MVGLRRSLSKFPVFLLLYIHIQHILRQLVMQEELSILEYLQEQDFLFKNIFQILQLPTILKMIGL